MPCLGAGSSMKAQRRKCRQSSGGLQGLWRTGLVPPGPTSADPEHALQHSPAAPPAHRFWWWPSIQSKPCAPDLHLTKGPCVATLREAWNTAARTDARPIQRLSSWAPGMLRHGQITQMLRKVHANSGPDFDTSCTGNKAGQHSCSTWASSSLMSFWHLQSRNNQDASKSEQGLLRQTLPEQSEQAKAVLQCQPEEAQT